MKHSLEDKPNSIATDPCASGLDEADIHADAMELRQVILGPGQHGIRLDKALAEVVHEFSRSYLQQLIEAGHVSVNNVVARKQSATVRCDDRMQISLQPTPQSTAFKPQAMALDVVYRDADVLVINKPAGLVVHPAPGNWSGTLLNGLLAMDAALMDVPRAGIVHRLDKDTSGLMVVARTRVAMDALVAAIAAREVDREYLAIAHGHWSRGPLWHAQSPIGRDPRNRLRMAVVDLSRQSGKVAATDIHVLDAKEKMCLVRCVLHTGRTHQIRVHMAEIGHPLAGDLVYGGKTVQGLAGQALHAFRLGFAHPITAQRLRFEAPLPPAFASLLTAEGLGYNGLKPAN
jgi:23S rRNA pseudouridine1911/1915/1917 synthase